MPTTTTAAAAAAAANGDGSEDYQPAGQAWPGRGEGTTHIGFVQRNACAYVGGEGGGGGGRKADRERGVVAYCACKR